VNNSCSKKFPGGVADRTIRGSLAILAVLAISGAVHAQENAQDNQDNQNNKEQTHFSSIPSLNTKGGSAPANPATGCLSTSDVGHQILVPYSADYYFFRTDQ